VLFSKKAWKKIHIFACAFLWSLIHKGETRAPTSHGILQQAYFPVLLQGDKVASLLHDPAEHHGLG
jgi:hypothetical protein